MSWLPLPMLRVAKARGQNHPHEGIDNNYPPHKINKTMKKLFAIGFWVAAGPQEKGGGHAWVCDGWQERRYEAIATFIPNRNDPKFELTRTSANGFAAYNTFLYPHGTTNADWPEDYSYFHMNLGWEKEDNAWYTYNTIFYKPNMEPFLKDQKTILISK